MALEHLAENLRLLCSYGKSTSDICRRLGINRHQFDAYLTGRSKPSLSTLRRICDFFGVDEYEILMDTKSFKDLVRVRPPRIGPKPDMLSTVLDKLIRKQTAGTATLENHAGYYHTYFRPDPNWPFIICSLSRIYTVDGNWFVKSVTWNRRADFSLPSVLKFTGLVFEGHQRIVVCEREQGFGRTMWTTMLFASDYAQPNYLPGVTLGMTPEGDHNIGAMRTVWHYLGKQPDLRKALRHLGVKALDASDLTEFVISGTDNSRKGGPSEFSGWF